MPRPFPDTVQDAPVIVRGTIGAKRVDWGRGLDESRRIYTYYDLVVHETLKGANAGTHLVFREMGGEKDGRGLQVAGSAEFSTGEDVVVLLNEQNGEGTYDLRGLMMGKLTVEKDDQGNEVLDGPALSPAGQFLHDDDRGGGKLALSGLRDILRSQGVTVAAKSAEPQRSSAPVQTPQTPQAGGMQTGDAALVPPLQSSPVEDSSSRVEWKLGLGVGIGLLAWLVLRKRSRRDRSR